MIAGLIVLVLLASLWAFAARLVLPDKVDISATENEINTLLPQTQCGMCGYKGCRPYAAAIATGLADINRCPPGGELGVIKLANFLGISAKPLDSSCGVVKSPAVAQIVEALCIGCTLCINACPVDAIVGAAKQMHTVLRAACTGCELCLPPCPVDCIRMEPLLQGSC